MLDLPVQMGRKLTVPEPVTLAAGPGEPAAMLEFEAAGTFGPPPGTASTNAEGGKPPTVCASPALSAYGTLSNNTRGCSASPCAWMPSQRASPKANKLAGKPWF